ncbi:MAG: four helix bundle protein [Chloroflexi bacterium]|nr:four helix bundle protein [Anaerolineaceae bacterium]NMB90863.1 four helix bundle protein [Chloroflexota bacterium]
MVSHPDDYEEELRKETARKFRELVAWQKGIALARLVYTLTAFEPPLPATGQVQRLRQTAILISSNVGEAQMAGSPAEQVVFLEQALAGLSELEDQLDLAVQGRVLVAGDLFSLRDNVSQLRRMLRDLVQDRLYPRSP